MEIPFQYGKLAENDSFIDREEDRRELKNFLWHGINTILVSPRRWGKSSLVKIAMKEIQEERDDIRVCFLDAYKIHTEEEFYNKFASAVVQGVASAMQQKLTEIMNFIKRITPSITIGGDPLNSIDVSLKMNPLKEIPEAILQLPEKIAKEKNLKIIICIDEFQQLANINGWKKLEALMRSEWQQQQNTTYCLYGSKMHRMTDIFNNANSPFFKFGQLLHLKRIDKKYWLPYITNGFERTSKHISEEFAERVCETVKYNSWYVQQYCFFLWSHSDKEVTENDLERQLQFLLDTNEEVFLNELDNLVASQIALLKAIAAGEQHFNAADVVNRYDLGLPRTITRNKNVLVSKDLVEKNKGVLQIIDPVFELWLKREYSL